MRRAVTRWTADEDATLLEVYLAGGDTAAMAARLPDRTVNAVMNRLHRIAAALPPVRPHCLAPADCVAAKPTSHCKRCLLKRIHADPELRERPDQAIRALFDDPAYRAAHAARAIATSAKARECPAFMQRLRDRGHIQYEQHLNSPEVRAKITDPENRRRAGAKIREHWLGWCPLHLRETYRILVHVKHVKAVEARAMVEEQMRLESPEVRARHEIARIDARQRDRAAREKAQAF